jgi:surface protein
MFYNAKSFNKPLDNWNVSSVTTMRWMFSGTDSFNQPLNNWNVSSATNMEGMFHNAIAFNQPLNSWDVSNVILMGHLVGDIQDYGMFENAISFNQDLSSWNFSSVQYMDDMLKNTNFSTTNYNNLLVKLAQSSLEENVTIGLGSIQYSPDYADERQYIIDTFGWTIEDGGVASE